MFSRADDNGGVYFSGEAKETNHHVSGNYVYARIQAERILNKTECPHHDAVFVNSHEPGTDQPPQHEDFKTIKRHSHVR